jgi:hypothetical protein
MAQLLTTRRRQVFVDRDALWRDYYTAFNWPRAGKDMIGTYRPTYGMAE